MGMDLKPLNPSSNAPRDEHNEPIWGRYNWAGWGWLQDWLDEHGVDISEFSGSNDGEVISADTCAAVATTLRENFEDLSTEDKEWLEPHIVRWQTCGGYQQW